MNGESFCKWKNIEYNCCSSNSFISFQSLIGGRSILYNNFMWATSLNSLQNSQYFDINHPVDSALDYSTLLNDLRKGLDNMKSWGNILMMAKIEVNKSMEWYWICSQSYYWNFFLHIIFDPYTSAARLGPVHCNWADCSLTSISALRWYRLLITSNYNWFIFRTCKKFNSMRWS